MLLCTDTPKHGVMEEDLTLPPRVLAFMGFCYLYGSLKLTADAYVNCMWQEETPVPHVIESSFSSLISFFLSLA